MSGQFPEDDGWIWRNGEFIPWKEAQVHVMSHVIHYGSSVFEGVRCYQTPSGPAVLRLQDHMRRFEDSARIYRMDLPYSSGELSECVIELIRRNELEECYIRPLALRGYGTVGLNPLTCPVEVYLACWPWGAYLGAEGLSSGVDVCVSSWQRPAANTFPMLAKAGGNYLNAQLMKMEAVCNGYAEAIALNVRGMVSEGSGQNLFLVRDGVVHTPALDGALLPGITRDCVLTLARERGIATEIHDIPREALYIADELFFTGTASEISPIRSVDRIAVGRGEPGPITLQLQKDLMDLAKGLRPDPHGWLTPVRAAEASTGSVTAQRTG
jgi:branched-chain amino acid aminotransferase